MISVASPIIEFPVHAAAGIFPMMSEESIRELAKDIEQHGLQSPITTYRGEILDGRNRFAACKIAGVTPEYRELDDDGTNPVDVISFVVSRNIHRRHLSQSQLALVAARVMDFERDSAKDRQRLGKERLPDPSIAGQARDKAGEMVGVSGRTVGKAAKVIRNGAPALVQLVETGEVSISAAADAADAKLLIQERAAFIGPTGIIKLAAHRRRLNRTARAKEANRPSPVTRPQPDPLRGVVESENSHTTARTDRRAAAADCREAQKHLADLQELLSKMGLLDEYLLHLHDISGGIAAAADGEYTPEPVAAVGGVL